MSSPAPPKATPKARASSKKLNVILRLPASVLSQFPVSQTPVRKVSRAKQTTASTSTPTVKPVELEPEESQPDQADTPITKQEIDVDNTTPAQGDSKRKGASGPKPGTKRSASALGEADGLPKARGKPGPKKKPRLDGELQASGAKGPFGGATPISTHKLGPKANQGAINAGLRALDRTGKPCRRWARKAFEVKSFTGVAWGLPSWRTPAMAESGFSGDVKSDTSGSVDAKGEAASSAVHSENGNSGGDVNGGGIAHDLASSPAPGLTPSTPVPA